MTCRALIAFWKFPIKKELMVMQINLKQQNWWLQCETDHLPNTVSIVVKTLTEYNSYFCLLITLVYWSTSCSSLQSSAKLRITTRRVGVVLCLNWPPEQVTGIDWNILPSSTTENISTLGMIRNLFVLLSLCCYQEVSDQHNIDYSQSTAPLFTMHHS